MSLSSLIIFHTLRVGKKNRIMTPIQIGNEILLVMKLCGLEWHNTINMVLKTTS
ncbi:MAG: hypothetical protein PWR21_1992 [Methanoculleus sp.]|nr:hypothetical protein [Methanoculleus sp.]